MTACACLKGTLCCQHNSGNLDLNWQSRQGFLHHHQLAAAMFSIVRVLDCWCLTSNISACRRYFTCALKHAQELAEQVKITSKRDKAGTVEMQEQVGMHGADGKAKTLGSVIGT
jgi:hypothetical protein